MRIAVISLIVILSFLLVGLYSKYNRLKIDLENKTLESHNLEIDKMNLSNSIHFQFSSEFTKVPKDFSMIADLNKEDLLLDQIIGDNPKLVFYIPESSCNSCSEEVFQIFKNINKYIIDEKIMIFTGDKKFREIKSLCKEKEVKVPIYIMKEDIDIEVAKKSLVPFFMLIDSSLTCRNVFIPNNANIDLTIDYLKNIERRL